MKRLAILLWFVPLLASAQVVEEVAQSVVTEAVESITEGAGAGISFKLTSTGDGTGVSTLVMTSSEDTEITLDGTGRFYSDAGGTLDESLTWTVTTGASRTRYIKCSSGTANFYIEKNTITQWGEAWVDGWVSSTNAASISGDVGQLTAVTALWVVGNNTLSGNIAKLTNLTYTRFSGGNVISGSIEALTSLVTVIASGSGPTTISGSVASLTSLTYLEVYGANTISGSIAGLTSLTTLNVGGSNTLSGSVAALTSLTFMYVSGSNTLSGSVAALTSLTLLEVQGINTISGSFNALTSLTSLGLGGETTTSGDLSLISAGIGAIYLAGSNQIDTYTAGGDWSAIYDQSSIFMSGGPGYGLSEAEVDLFINEVESTRAAGRHLHLTLTGSNAARSSASDAAVTAIENDGGTVTTN